MKHNIKADFSIHRSEKVAKIGGGRRRPPVRVRDDQLAALSAQSLGARPHREGPGAASAGRAALLGGGQGEHACC